MKNQENSREPVVKTIERMLLQYINLDKIKDCRLYSMQLPRHELAYLASRVAYVKKYKYQDLDSEQQNTFNLFQKHIEHAIAIHDKYLMSSFEHHFDSDKSFWLIYPGSISLTFMVVVPLVAISSLPGPLGIFAIFAGFVAIFAALSVLWATSNLITSHFKACKTIENNYQATTGKEKIHPSLRSIYSLDDSHWASRRDLLINKGNQVNAHPIDTITRFFSSLANSVKTSFSNLGSSKSSMSEKASTTSLPSYRKAQDERALNQQSFFNGNVHSEHQYPQGDKQDSSHGEYQCPQGDKQDSSHGEYQCPQGDKQDSSHGEYQCPQGNRQDSSAPLPPPYPPSYSYS